MPAILTKNGFGVHFGVQTVVLIIFKYLIVKCLQSEKWCSFWCSNVIFLVVFELFFRKTIDKYNNTCIITNMKQKNEKSGIQIQRVYGRFISVLDSSTLSIPTKIIQKINNKKKD